MRLLSVALLGLAFSPAVAAPVPAKAAASPADVLLVLDELGLDDRFTDPTALPKGYEPAGPTADEVRREPDKYPLRAAVLHAVRVAKEARKYPLFRSAKDGGGDAVAKQVLAAQEGPALLVLELEEAAEQLKKARAAEPAEASKRWLAHADYVQAELVLLTTVVHEYNVALGTFRRGDLPELDPAKGQNGWRLVRTTKVRLSREVKQAAEKIRVAMEKVAGEHAGTPWARLAEGQAKAPLGFAWEPSDVSGD